MNLNAEDLEKYITHKNIFEYFNKNANKNEMILYTSLVGNITVNGYKSSSQSFTLLKPCEVILRRKKNILTDTYGKMDDLFEELSGKHSIFSRNRQNKKGSDEWTLYPNDTITHFEYSVEVIKDSDEIPNNYLERLKFFPNMEMAEVNFIKMMEYHLDKSGLTEALETYKILDKKLGDKYPDYFL